MVHPFNLGGLGWDHINKYKSNLIWNQLKVINKNVLNFKLILIKLFSKISMHFCQNKRIVFLKNYLFLKQMKMNSMIYSKLNLSNRRSTSL